MIIPPFSYLFTVQTSDNLSRIEATASSERLFLYIFNAQRIAVSFSVVLRFVPIVFLHLDCDSMVSVSFEFSAICCVGLVIIFVFFSVSCLDLFLLL